MVYNKFRSDFVLRGVMIGIDGWTPQTGQTPMRIFNVFEPSSKKVVQVKIAGKALVDKHKNKLRENHICIVRGAIAEPMPRIRETSLKGDFRLKMVPFSTLEVLNVSPPFNIHDVADNFVVQTVESIQLLNVSKGKWNCLRK